MGTLNPATIRRIEISCETRFDHPIEVNGTPFACISAEENRSLYEIAGPPPPKQPVHGLFIQTIVSEEILGFLPHEIDVNGRRYLRQFRGFYLPKDRSEDEVATFFDFIAPDYERFVNQRFNEVVIHELLKIITDNLKSRTLTILDYGIGPGFSVAVKERFFRDFLITLVGADIAYLMVMRARGTGITVNWVKQGNTGFPSETVDGVFFSFVTSYFVDDKPFAESFRVLKPGGVITFNLHRFEWLEVPDYIVRLARVGFVDFDKRNFKKPVPGSDGRIVTISAKKPGGALIKSRS